jgi:hypothetical protein
VFIKLDYALDLRQTKKCATKPRFFCQFVLAVTLVNVNSPKMCSVSQDVNSRVQIQAFVGVIILACLCVNISCCIFAMNIANLQTVCK